MGAERLRESPENMRLKLRSYKALSQCIEARQGDIFRVMLHFTGKDRAIAVKVFNKESEQIRVLVILSDSILARFFETAC